MSMWSTHNPATEAPKDFNFSAAHLNALTGTGDYLGGNVAQGFDDSIAGVMIDQSSMFGADPDKELGAEIWRGRQYMGREISPDAISEEDWTHSPHYRENLAFDQRLSPLQHKERARQYDEREMRKIKLSSYEPSILETVAGFGAQMLGASASPETFMPVGGVALRGVIAARAAKAGWGARGGAVAADIGAGAVEGVVGSAIALPMIAGQRDYMGDAMSVAEMGMDLALSAFGGAVLSGLGGVAARKFNPDLWTSVYQKKRIVQGVAKAAQAMRKGEFDYRDPELDAMTAEKTALGKAYDEVYYNPLGDPDDPLVKITAEGIEATIIERGQFKDLTGVQVKGSGYGLVKFVFKHGEGGDKPVRKQIQKSDVTEFPNIIRYYDAQESQYKTSDGSYARNSSGRMWVIERDDGEWVLYADQKFKEDGKNRMVTMHVLDDEVRQHYTLSAPKKTPHSEPRQSFQDPVEATQQNAYYRKSAGEQDNRQDGASEDSLAQEAEFVEMELEAMREGGEFSTEEAESLAFADQEVARAEAIGRGLEAGALCVARRG